MMVWRLTWISRLIACCMVAVMACTTLAPVVAAAPLPAPPARRAKPRNVPRRCRYTLTLREPERIACQSESSGFC